MGKSYGIQPTKIHSQSNRVIPGSFNDNVLISLNFKRLCIKQDKFNYLIKDKDYFIKLIERLKAIGGMTRKEMSNNWKSLRCHPINFKDSRVSEFGFGILSEDVDGDAWQFQVCSNEHGRVHGYFVGSIFYVVWLDPEHELYPGDK